MRYFKYVELKKLHNNKYEIINEKNPAIIAFSTTTYTLDRCSQIAKKIRNKIPEKLTVLGGSHANVAAMETANNYDYFDIISYGLDGEYIIYDIVKKYSLKIF